MPTIINDLVDKCFGFGSRGRERGSNLVFGRSETFTLYTRIKFLFKNVIIRHNYFSRKL